MKDWKYLIPNVVLSLKRETINTVNIWISVSIWQRLFLLAYYILWMLCHFLVLLYENKTKQNCAMTTVILSLLGSLNKSLVYNAIFIFFTVSDGKLLSSWVHSSHWSVAALNRQKPVLSTKALTWERKPLCYERGVTPETKSPSRWWFCILLSVYERL